MAFNKEFLSYVCAQLNHTGQLVLQQKHYNSVFKGPKKSKCMLTSVDP